MSAVSSLPPPLEPRRAFRWRCPADCMGTDRFPHAMAPALFLLLLGRVGTCIDHKPVVHVEPAAGDRPGRCRGVDAPRVGRWPRLPRGWHPWRPVHPPRWLCLTGPEVRAAACCNEPFVHGSGRLPGKRSSWLGGGRPWRDMRPRTAAPPVCGASGIGRTRPSPSPCRGEGPRAAHADILDPWGCTGLPCVVTQSQVLHLPRSGLRRWCSCGPGCGRRLSIPSISAFPAVPGRTPLLTSANRMSPVIPGRRGLLPVGLVCVRQSRTPGVSVRAFTACTRTGGTARSTVCCMGTPRRSPGLCPCPRRPSRKARVARFVRVHRHGGCPPARWPTGGCEWCRKADDRPWGDGKAPAPLKAPRVGPCVDPDPVIHAGPAAGDRPCGCRCLAPPRGSMAALAASRTASMSSGAAAKAALPGCAGHALRRPAVADSMAGQGCEHPIAAAWPGIGTHAPAQPGGHAWTRRCRSCLRSRSDGCRLLQVNPGSIRILLQTLSCRLAES